MDNHQSCDAGAFACNCYKKFTFLKISSKVLLAAAIIIFVEKLFLNFVAINFHQKALADRLEENRLGLKALDSLSKAQPVASKKPPHHRRGQKRMSTVATTDLATLPHQEEQQDDTINISTTRGHHTTLADDSGMFPSKISPELQLKRRTKKVTSVIVNQVRYLAYQTNLLFDCVSNQGGRSNRSICTEKFQVL